MDKTQVISKLRQHEPELKAAGIAHVHLFGSTARGEATPASDIDLMIDFDESKPQSLMSLSRLKNQLTALLGHDVDISCTDCMYEHIRKQALREAVSAFSSEEREDTRKEQPCTISIESPSNPASWAAKPASVACVSPSP